MVFINRALLRGMSSFKPVSTRSAVGPMSSFSSSAASGGLVSLQLNEDTGIATLQMNNPPVNSLSLDMLQAISNGIKEAESIKARGLVLSSSLPSVFSAGLDLMEMHKPDPDRLNTFWRAFQQVYLDLYGCRLPCVAAIEGHAPAGGCMLALCCDYRVMAGSDSESGKAPTIGLNESKLGIMAPPWLAQMFVDTLGHREAEKGLILGLLYSPEQALDIKLVDEVVPKANVLQRAQEEAVKWSQIPPQALYGSKMLTRQKHLDHLESTRELDSNAFCMFAQNESVQANLDAYVKMLQAKKAKKSNL